MLETEHEESKEKEREQQEKMNKLKKERENKKTEEILFGKSGKNKSCFYLLHWNLKNSFFLNILVSACKKFYDGIILSDNYVEFSELHAVM